MRDTIPIAITREARAMLAHICEDMARKEGRGFIAAGQAVNTLIAQAYRRLQRKHKGASKPPEARP